MKEVDLFQLVKSGESATVEFKQQFPTHPKIAKEMIAFANSKGGVLIFGIKDNGKIIGVDSEKEITNLVTETAKDYCEPPIKINIEYFEFKGKEIVVVQINESDKKPHRIQDYNEKMDLNTAQVYVRVNDKSVPASKEMIRLLRNQTSGKPLVKYRVGDDEKKAFEYLERNETITVKELSDYANISKRRASRALVKLVRAGLLFLHTKENGKEFFTYISE